MRLAWAMASRSLSMAICYPVVLDRDTEQEIVPMSLLTAACKDPLDCNVVRCSNPTCRGHYVRLLSDVLARTHRLGHAQDPRPSN